ncbi:hypothetical protein EAE96_003236 [Botrytis aclada]|nr:hypothetical protein EAE96_003236 [Botrytis aclada]
MYFMKLAVLAVLPVRALCPNEVCRDAPSNDDKSIIYPEYRRSASDESVVDLDYRIDPNPAGDESVFYPDYCREVVGADVDATKEDSFVICPDYRRDID